MQLLQRCVLLGRGGDRARVRVDTNAWESLPQMDTGYSCSADTTFYFTLNQVIDTTSSANGFDPLPSGSLALTWSAYTANVSGFGGYSRSGPHYTFGGNGYKPGNEQVYWGFLRDGVNFGPGSSGGDNDQPGYSINITGVKSVFTNGAYARPVDRRLGLDAATDQCLHY